MGRAQVGLPRLQGDIAKYQRSFDIVEIRLDSIGMPKAATLRAWRKAVGPGFTFSVVLPRAIGELAPSKETERALESSMKVATALEARCIVLETPATVRPTKSNRDKLRALTKTLQRSSVAVCWEPHGVWEVPEIHATAKSLGVVAVLDATRDALPPGSAVYTRIRSLGQSGVGPRAIARLVEQIEGRRDAWIIVDERRSASRVRAAIAAPRAQGRDGAPPIVVRPSPGRLRAEDEEQ
jgi:uncharacterized protein YecE (DUF72 family)